MTARSDGGPRSGAADAPIGVFDSGVGGLTVLRALRSAMPAENFIYLGYTARLPYGTKSPETVGQYALQAARLLMQENIKLLVVACNTASALGLPVLRQNLPALPCFSVIVKPGPTVPVSVGVAANAAGTASIATSANRTTYFIRLPRSVSLDGTGTA